MVINEYAERKVFMTKIIHVNRQLIAMNAKDGQKRPVYIVKEGKTTKYAQEIEINGPSKLVYNGSQLNCGARAWIETNSDINIIGESSFQEIKRDFNE